MVETLQDKVTERKGRENGGYPCLFARKARTARPLMARMLSNLGIDVCWGAALVTPPVTWPRAPVVVTAAAA